MRGGEEEQHTAHQSLLTTVLTPDMSRVTPGELQPGSSAGPGQEEGNQWLAGYGCVVPGEDRRGGRVVNWTKQPIILTVELRWLLRAAWADTGLIFAAGSSQLSGTGGGAPHHGTGQGQYTRIKMIQSDTITQLVTQLRPCSLLDKD